MMVKRTTMARKRICASLAGLVIGAPVLWPVVTRHKAYAAEQTTAEKKEPETSEAKEESEQRAKRRPGFFQRLLDGGSRRREVRQYIHEQKPDVPRKMARREARRMRRSGELERLQKAKALKEKQSAREVEEDDLLFEPEDPIAIPQMLSDKTKNESKELQFSFDKKDPFAIAPPPPGTEESESEKSTLAETDLFPKAKKEVPTPLTAQELQPGDEFSLDMPADPQGQPSKTLSESSPSPAQPTTDPEELPALDFTAKPDAVAESSQPQADGDPQTASSEPQMPQESLAPSPLDLPQIIPGEGSKTKSVASEDSKPKEDATSPFSGLKLGDAGESDLEMSTPDAAPFPETAGSLSENNEDLFSEYGPPAEAQAASLLKSLMPKIPDIPAIATEPQADEPKSIAETAPHAPGPDAQGSLAEPSTLVAPSTARRLEPSTPQTEPSKEDKLLLIASRRGQPGFRGFCPVVLRDQRDLVDARPEFSSVYAGKRYYFSSAEALVTFESDQSRYVPAQSGADVIHLALTGEYVEGNIEHAVWYHGRLYMFTSAETMETFVSAPSSHAGPQNQ